MTPTLRDAEQYVTRNLTYVEGEFDCASLALLVQRELFGRDIPLPAAGSRAKGRRGQARDIQNYQPDLADKVETPSTGNAVILWETTPDGEPPFDRQWHIGTAFVQDGACWVLHCANEASGVRLQRLEHIVDAGMHLDGFYAWRDAPKLALNVIAHPLGGQIEHRHTPAGRTLAETLQGEGIFGAGWEVRVSGYLVPAPMWERTRVKPGQLIEARSLTNRSALSLVAIAALSYFTAGIAGGAYAGAFGAGSLAASSVGAFALSAAVYVGGSMLISKLLSPKASSAGDMSGNEPPPTYSLAGGRNRPRQWEPLSLVLGETKVVPDMANQPFSWFDGDDQYLYQTFHAGINCVYAEDIRNGDTSFSVYEGVTISKYDFPGTPSAGQYPPLGNSVDTIEGGLLDAPTAPGAWVERTTSVGTSRVQIDLEMQLIYLNPKGEYQQVNVQVEYQYRVKGSTNWIPMFAPVFTNASGKPTRRTLTFDFPVAGQYDVRGRKFADANYTVVAGPTNVVSWASLKSFQPDNSDYGGQPRVNIQVKASGQLSGSLNEVNWIARGAPMPLWNGTAWVTVSQPGANGISNPGAQILHLMRGIYRPSDGKLIAGAGIPESRIDLSSIQAFMVRCSKMGFRFDAVIQEPMNLQDLLESIAAAGLGSLSRHSGKYGVTWSAEDEPIAGVINMGTMKVRSFSVAYDLSQTADEYSLEYFDRDRGYTWLPVRVVAPGTGTPQRTSTENVRGVTTAAHAAIMARFAMAQNIFGRKTITFDMDLEHLTVRRGMVVALSHDLTQWGYSGRIAQVTLSSGQFVIEVDEPIPVSGPSSGTIGLRLSGETQMRTFNVASMSADRRQLRVAQAWPANVAPPGVASPARDALWIFDNKSTPGYKVRILSIEPADGMTGAQISVVPESPEFWNYVLNGDYTPPPDNSLLVRGLPVASNLRISRALVRSGDAFAHELTALFDVSGPYDHAQLWAAPAGAPLVQVGGEVYGTSVSWVVPPDQSWTVQIRPFDGLGRAGTFVTDTFIDPSEQVAGVLGFSVRIEDVGAVAHWTAPQGLAAIGWATTVIRLGATWETAVKVFEGRTDRANLGWLVAGTPRFWAANRNTAGDFSPPVSYAIQILPPAQPIVEGRAIRDQVELSWAECTTTQPLRGYEIRIGNLFNNAPVIDVVTGRGFVRTETTPGKRLYWVTAIDLGGNRSQQGYKEIETLPGIEEALAELEAGFDEEFAAIREIAAQQSFIRANLLYNGGFEQGKDGWTTLDADGFTLGAEYWGAYALIVTPQASGEIAGKAAFVEPGKPYIGAADTVFISPSGTSSLSLRFRNAAGTVIATVNGPALGNHNFSNEPGRRNEVAVAGVAPTGAASAVLVMTWAGYSGGGAVGIRYAKIEQGPMPSTAYTTETTDIYLGAAVRQTTQVANDNAAKMAASYTLTVTAGKRISAIRAYADNTTSRLTFISSEVFFAIGDVDTAKPLMSLGMVNGTPSVGVNGNFYLDGAFKARMIDAEQIYGTHIVGREIEARHIKVGSLTADVINIGVGVNLVPNATLTERPGTQGAPNGWGTFENVLGAIFGTQFSDQYSIRGGVSGYIQQPNQNYNGFPFFERNAQTSCPAFPVIPGKRYEFHARLVAHRCNATVVIQFVDFNGTAVASKAAEIKPLPSGNANTLVDYAKVGDFAVAPANAVMGIITIIKSSTLSGFADSYLFWTQPFIAEATNYQTVLSPYSPSGLGTKITPQGITTPNLSALSGDMGTLNAGQLTINGDVTGGGGYGFVRSPEKWYGSAQGWILARGANGDSFIDFTTGGFYFRMRSGPIETIAAMDWGGIYMDSTGRLEIRKDGVISTPNMTGGAVTSYSYAEFPPNYVFYAQGDKSPELGLFNVSSEGGFILFEITAIASPNAGPDTGGGD